MGGLFLKYRQVTPDFNLVKKVPTAEAASLESVLKAHERPDTEYRPALTYFKDNSALGRIFGMGMSCAGTCQVIHPAGYVLSSYHQLEEYIRNPDQKAYFHDAIIKDSYPIEILAYSKSSDLALFKIETSYEYPVVYIAEKSPKGSVFTSFFDNIGAVKNQAMNVLSGNTSVATSAELELSICAGRVVSHSADGKYFTIQETPDVSIERGNSGSPVWNLDNELVGVSIEIDLQGNVIFAGTRNIRSLLETYVTACKRSP
ncbi:MAG TPA: serine protease [Candidatus Nanoarchaeia archaeon]|nr:serine protease [Candidatus Nanoarchaeia archaeon]